MRTLYFCLVATAMATSSLAQTTVPATPSLTVGAQVKGLRFDWDLVPGAEWYQLEYKSHKNDEFAQHGFDFDASTTMTHFRFPLHLYFWTDARYRLAACNSVGCTRSTEVSVSALRRFAVGYFKAAQARSGIRFGADTDISAGALDLVSAAPGELISSSAGARPGGALYVFRRFAGVWKQRVRLEPTIPPFIDDSNVMRVAMSGDGNTVALGMPNYLHAPPDTQGDTQSGEVFVFHGNGTRWVRTRIPPASRSQFGRWVGLNDAGDTLAVGYGVSSSPSRPPKVALYKLVNGAWQQVRDIGGIAGRAEICVQGVLSNDGSTVAESCHANAVGTTPARVYVRTHSGTNWGTRADLPLEMAVDSPYGFGHGAIAIDGTGNTVAAQIFAANDGPSEVHVFEREDGVYQKEAVLTPGAWRSNARRSSFGQSIAISGNGVVLAVGDSLDNGTGNGPRAAPLLAGQSSTGAVYVYRYKDDWWYLYNMVKPNYHPDNAPNLTFGSDVKFSANGVSMLVGDSGENSNAVGVGGGWSNLRAPGSGAVWLY